MKVLSLTEPFATLIQEQKKKIETRSWKTNYRGPLYIHASQTKCSSESLHDRELMALINNTNLNFGHIICKCNLVDCVYMTKEYVENMKKNNHQEYICGDYRIGRYAWILEDIEVINPIKVKGQLNLWNYYTEQEVMKKMSEIEYGWVDKDNHKYIEDYEFFANKYLLQSPNEVIKNKLGVCWDQVELERYYFKGNDWNLKTYFMVHYDQDTCPTHTFLTYEKNNKYYWFEHAWGRFKGIHEYNSREELLQDVKDKFIKYELDNPYEIKNLCLYEYSKPKYHINVQEFFRHCESGRKIY